MDREDWRIEDGRRRTYAAIDRRFREGWHYIDSALTNPTRETPEAPMTDRPQHPIAGSLTDRDVRELLHCAHRELARIGGAARAHEAAPRTPSPSANDADRIAHLSDILTRGGAS